MAALYVAIALAVVIVGFGVYLWYVSRDMRHPNMILRKALRRLCLLPNFQWTEETEMPAVLRKVRTPESGAIRFKGPGNGSFCSFNLETAPGQPSEMIIVTHVESTGSDSGGVIGPTPQLRAFERAFNRRARLELDGDWLKMTVPIDVLEPELSHIIENGLYAGSSLGAPIELVEAGRAAEAAS